MTVYLDFDGTVVEHAYPKIGRQNFGCGPVIQALIDAGHEVLLNTMRSNFGPEEIQAAHNYLHLEFDIHIGATPKKLHPFPWNLEDAFITQRLYIDDIALGIPLEPAKFDGGRMVDWKKVRAQLLATGIIVG